MYAGEIVEMGDVRDIFYRPQHPYTQSLINAVPTVADLPPTSDGRHGGIRPGRSSR